MRIQFDWSAWTTWMAIGALFGVLIPLIVFLSGDELLLTILATAMGGGLGCALWAIAQRGNRRG